MMTIRDLSVRLGSLVVLRGVLRDETVIRFAAMLKAALAYSGDAAPLADAVADFEASLLPRGEVWSRVLLDIVLGDDNLCIRRSQTRDGAGEVAEGNLARDLSVLQAAGSLTLADLLAPLEGGDALLHQMPLPWKVEPELAFAKEYAARRRDVSRTGYGIFARYHVFTLEEGVLTPVRCPDPQRLSELPGYEREREKIIENTEALLSGLPSANVLLYGDAGTGKSSTVKALANEYHDRGLRLVEIKKHQLYQMPALMDELADNPLKFILFIDDLSFSSNDDNFAALKAILEGSVGGRSRNVAVYATSNRRHLVKETMSDRTAGDDIHAADTRQELMSLSARFGLTVTFQRPDKTLYENIVMDLAQRCGVQMPSDQLMMRAEAFALRAGGRSPRVAKQFVELLAAGVRL